MANWTYPKDGGENYPVQPGQLWHVGPHAIGCGDLMADGAALLDRMKLETPPTLVYTDPPWQQGNLNSFQTKAGLGRAQYPYQDLYTRITEIAPVPLWIESGQREIPIVQKLLPGPHTAVFDVTYYRTKPSALHYSGTVEPPTDPSGLDDDHTPGKVLDAYQNGTVVDPCAGRGLTAVTAHKRGWTFIGLELSQYRTSVTLTKLAKLTGEEPKLVN